MSDQPTAQHQTVSNDSPVSPNEDGGEDRDASPPIEDQAAPASGQMSHPLPPSPPESVHGRDGSHSDREQSPTPSTYITYVGDYWEAPLSYVKTVEDGLVIPDLTWNQMTQEERDMAGSMARSNISASTAVYTDRLLNTVAEELGKVSDYAASQSTAS